MSVEYISCSVGTQEQDNLHAHIRTLMIQTVYCVCSSERCNLQGNCAVLRESSIVGRPTVARKHLILRLNTTQGAGVGSRTADEQYIAHKCILCTTTVSVTNCSRLLIIHRVDTQAQNLSVKTDLLSSLLIVLWLFDCPIATAYHIYDRPAAAAATLRTSIYRLLIL